jgi:ParB-like chromosome segregation protein Spo0J
MRRPIESSHEANAKEVVMATNSKKPVYSPIDGKPTSIPVADIAVGTRLRSLDEAAVKLMSESMSAGGLKTPITVRRAAEGWALVVGRHRLEAARRLGWSEISAVIMVGDEADARVWEIVENLHRAELNELEHSNHIAEWVQLVAAKTKVTQLVSPSGPQPLEQGIRKAARELGVSQPEVQRALKIASLSPEAKAAAVDAGLDNNQSALLVAAKEEAGHQVAKVAEIAQKKKARKARVSVRLRRQRKAGAIKSEPTGNASQEEIESAVRNIAALIVEHIPEAFLVSLIKSVQAVGRQVHIGDIERPMRDLRPELFKSDDNMDTVGTAIESRELLPQMS